MIEFYQTVMGKQFYQGTLPSIAKELSRIADALEKANALKERELDRNASCSCIKTSGSQRQIESEDEPRED